MHGQPASHSQSPPAHLAGPRASHSYLRSFRSLPRLAMHSNGQVSVQVIRGIGEGCSSSAIPILKLKNKPSACHNSEHNPLMRYTTRKEKPPPSGRPTLLRLLGPSDLYSPQNQSARVALQPILGRQERSVRTGGTHAPTGPRSSPLPPVPTSRGCHRRSLVHRRKRICGEQERTVSH